MVDTLDTRLARGQSVYIRRFTVEIVEGPDRGKRATLANDELTIGTDQGVDLQLTDPAVSRHHCALRATPKGIEVRDLGSTNGTLVASCEIVRAYVTSGTRLRIGGSVGLVESASDAIELPLAATDRYGGLIGSSIAMRRIYPILDRFATSDGTVLVTGETGTGKELAAEAIHRASRYAGGRFVAVNCGALPARLTESELFGHVRGAFTGADRARDGAFVEADGGTIFLDEIGELPLAMQPTLLRVLENKTIRPLGSAIERSVDVRVVAATHRDLREAVNRRAFRADLYYRLNVLPVELPPLRQRAGDIELLAAVFWREVRKIEPPAELITLLSRQSWPGNVRELRNAVERASLIGWSDLDSAGESSPYGEAKRDATAAWERDWVAALLMRHDGNLSAAARSVQMGRGHLRRLARRHGVSRSSEDGEGAGGDTES